MDDQPDMGYDRKTRSLEVCVCVSGREQFVPLDVRERERDDRHSAACGIEGTMTLGHIPLVSLGSRETEWTAM